MNTFNARKISYAGFLLILAVVQSACAAPAPAVLTQTVVVNTSTAMATSTPADTPTPQATATFTETPAPTATSTPNVTPTLLPELPAAAEGKANVAGLVLWNHQPVPQAAVWLCEKFEGACLGTYQYRTNTDANGYYVFENVIPGKYLVAINSFNSGWFIFYFDADGNREQQVSADENLILDPLSIWKIDLRPGSPKYGRDISDAHPTFTWDPYPDAAYYLFSIYDTHFNTVLDSQKVHGSEYVLEEATLVTCNYYWTVEAYNADDIKISQLKAPNSTLMYFINHSVPGKCE